MSDTGLPVEDRLRLGVQTIHRRTEPAIGAWLPRIDEMRSLVELVDRSGYDSLWVGDHISFHIAILDPLLQLAQAAVISRRLITAAWASCSNGSKMAMWKEMWSPTHSES